MRKNLDHGLVHAMSAFVRVADAGSFTAAAEQLHLTVAQTSRLVSDLEKRLRTRLLQRTTRKLALTSAGRAYLERSRNILGLIAEAEGDALESGLQPSGQLRVSSMMSFGTRYVIPRIQEYCLRYPQVTVEYSVSQLVPALSAEGIDVSIYPSQRLQDSALITRRLGTTFGVMCASPNYVMEAGLPSHPAELRSHPCLRLSNPSVTPQWELLHSRSTERTQIDASGPLIGDIPDVLVQGALGGLGITLLPVYTVIDYLRSGKLIHVLPEWRSSEIGVYLLIPSGQFVDAKTRTWMQFMNNHLPDALARDCDLTGVHTSLKGPPPRRNKATG